MNRRAYIFSEKIQNWIPEWLCSKSIHFPSKRTIILCFVEVILYGIFVVFICISILKNLTKKVGFQAILLGRKSQELWVFLEKVWFSWWLFDRLSTVGYLLDIDEIMVSACIQNTNLTRNSAKSVKKNTICNKKAPIFCDFVSLSCSTGREFLQNVSTFRKSKHSPSWEFHSESHFFTTLKRLCYLVKPKNTKISDLC